MTQKNIALYVVLSIVTCGIFSLVWFYQIASDLYNTNNNLATSPGITILLSIVTCGIYSYYVYYKWGKAINEIMVAKGAVSDDKAILYLILCIFGLGIVSMALIQSDLNQIAEAA